MNNIDLAYFLKLPPEKAIAYFKAKGFAISWDWHDVWQQAHAKAFTVAKAMKLDILQDIHDSLTDALDTGVTYRQWADGIKPRLKARGWWGEVVNEQTGEVATVGGWRLRTIFDVNIQTAYNVGRYRSQTANIADRPYWQYVAVMDARTRPAHAALNGSTFRADDPFWNSFYPPNGWRCRCRVRALDARDLTDRDITALDSAGRMGSIDKPLNAAGDMASVATYTGRDPFDKKFTVAPDAGWSYNPGAVDWRPDLDRYSPEIRKLW